MEPSREDIARLIAVPGVDRTRVERAEKVRNLALETRGWNLAKLTRHTDFAAENGQRYFPTERTARQALGLPS